jgi:GNAT superfamily N-acetyltransferase
MSAGGYRVEKLVAGDVEATARVLADAFFDNPCYSFIHWEGERRAQSMLAFFRRNLVWHLPLDLTWVTRGDDGAVLGTLTLEPPHGLQSSLLRALRHWALPTLREDGFETLRRLVLTDGEFKAEYQTMCGQQAYWHVHAVAVSPDQQGRGIGQAMLHTALEALRDLTRERPAPVVLSTQRERNLPFYAAQGFVLTHQTTLGQARGAPGYTSWFMHHPALSLRPPTTPRPALSAARA